MDVCECRYLQQQPPPPHEPTDDIEAAAVIDAIPAEYAATEDPPVYARGFCFFSGLDVEGARDFCFFSDAGAVGEGEADSSEG